MRRSVSFHLIIISLDLLNWNKSLSICSNTRAPSELTKQEEWSTSRSYRFPLVRFFITAFLGSFSSWTELNSVISKSISLSGFPPIPGHKSTGAEQGFVAALVAADKLTATDTGEIADEQNDEEEVCWKYNFRAILFFLWAWNNNKCFHW